MDYNLPDSSVQGILKEEYWSGFPFPSSGDLPDPGNKLGSPTLQADTLPSGPPGKLHMLCMPNSKMGGRRKWNEFEPRSGGDTNSGTHSQVSLADTHIF